MRVFSYFTAIVLFVLLSACSASKQASSSSKDFSPRIAFYNVENLFDTEDDPLTRDESFTPQGRNKWDEDRYKTKLSNLHKIVRAMDYPALLGVCEVENKKVLQALADSCQTRKGSYAFCHYESGDKRGIDVALLYAPKVFEVTNTQKITTTFPKVDGEEYTSRDILHVTGTYRKKHRLHIFVNHWPSRRGGLKASQPRRILVANNLRKAVDQIITTEENPKIIIMGDFNDEPSNESVAEVLMAFQPTPNTQSKALYNQSYPAHNQGLGTYNYRGNWNQLDQIIISGALMDGSSALKVSEAKNFREEWMMYVDKKRGATPNRTYGGPNYYGGYSDHLPVFADFYY